MLDVQAKYLPDREITPGLKPVSPAAHKRKPADRQNSFNRLLERATTNNIGQKQHKIDTEQSYAEQKDVTDSVKKPIMDKAENNSDPRLEQHEQQIGVDQTNSEITTSAAKQEEKPATSQEPDIDTNIDVNAVLMPDTSQLVLMPVNNQVLSSNEVNEDLSVTSLAADKPAGEGMDSLTSQDSLPAEKSASLLNAELKSPGNEFELNSNGDDLTIPELTVGNEAQDGSKNINPVLNREIQTQPDNKNAQSIMSGESIQVEYSNSQAISNDMVTAQANSLTEQSNTQVNEKNTLTGLAPTVMTAMQEITTPRITGQQSADVDDVESVLPDESGNSVKVDQEKKNINPEDIRLKLLTTLSADSSKKPSENAPVTDVKKLMGSEILRQRTEKPGMNEVVLPETQVTENQPETQQIVPGVDKSLLSSPKSGIDSQMIRPEVPAPTVDPRDIIEQIVKKVELVNKATSSEMQIQLKPEFLGKILIKIALDDGVVTARFITESHQVKHQLEANLGSLKQSLEAQGLKVDRTEVNVALDNGGAFHGNESGRQQMWQEYADRNSHNRLPYQAEEGYGGASEAAFESYGETDPVKLSSLLGDGRVDFMI